MSRPGSPLPYRILTAVVGGLLLIVAVSRCIAHPPDAPTAPAFTPSRHATPTPSADSSAASPSTVFQTPEPRAAAATPTDPSTEPSATLTPEREPTLTPTPAPVALSPPFVGPSGALAYVEGGRLVVIRSDGSKATVISDGVAHGAEAVRWSPDGRRLVYATGTDPAAQDSASGHQTFHVWDSRLGETLRLSPEIPGLPPDASAIHDATWSPEGTRILLRSSSNASSPTAWVFDLMTNRAWRLPEPSTGHASWIDEDTILSGTSEGGPSRLVSVGPPAQALTQTSALTGVYTLSPDRDFAASFVGQPGESQKLQLVSLSSLAPVASHPLSPSHQPSVTLSAEGPFWSPDGRWLAYGAEPIAAHSGNGPHTLLVDTIGASTTQRFPGLLPVAWSPDSRLLVGFGCSETKCSLSLLNAVTGHATSLVSASYLRLWDAAWSPGGVYLIYSVSGAAAQKDGLVLWNRATGEHRRLMEASEAQPLTDLQWVAGGCTLFVARRNQTDQVSHVAPDRVSEIWRVGPSWEDRWLVVSGSSGDSPRPSVALSPQPALAGALEQRERNPGTQPLRSESPTSLCPEPLLDDRRLIAFYGTGSGPGLGILGRYGISHTLQLLKEQTEVYRDLDPATHTIPAFHMVTTIADDFAGPDGNYNHRVRHETTRRWIDAIEAEGGWSILDVQPGRADLIDELDALEPLLLEPGVHLAVDPEFIVGEDQIPGEDLGQITGPQINWVQARMDEVARETGQRKLLVIHQFDDRMIEHKEMILHYPLVDLVWDADGFGSPGSKRSDYDQYQGEAGFEYGGFKIFYRYDQPVMTAEEVLSLDPPPALVIYQ